MSSVSDNQEIYVGSIVTNCDKKYPLIQENAGLVIKNGIIIAKASLKIPSVTFLLSIFHFTSLKRVTKMIF